MDEEKNIVTVENLTILRITKKAILVCPDGDEQLQVWIPKSQIEGADFNGLTLEQALIDGVTGTIRLPEWLADDKCLDYTEGYTDQFGLQWRA